MRCFRIIGATAGLLVLAGCGSTTTTAPSTSPPGIAGSTAAPVVTTLTPTSGPAAGGTAVTITGSHFTGATSVTFGGKAATFHIVSDTEITTTSPSHAVGSVSVKVHSPAGHSSKTHKFTYV